MNYKLRQENALIGLEAMNSEFPDLFNPLRPKPLAIGMTLQLAKARRAGTLQITCMQQRLAMKLWLNRYNYHQCVAATPFRYNLDGSVFCVISDDHRQHAINELKSINKLKKARKVSVKKNQVKVEL